MAKIRLNADVDAELVRPLQHLLVDEGITFAEWLRQQIRRDLTRLERLRQKADPEEEGRYTPAGQWVLGDDYFRSAEHVLEREKRYIFTPWYHLVSHSIELALKAFLMSKKVSVGRLKGVGHDLVDLLQLADGHGLRDVVPLEQRHVDAITLINPLHQDRELHYRKRGFKQFPPGEDLRLCAKMLLEGTMRLCTG